MRWFFVCYKGYKHNDQPTDNDNNVDVDSNDNIIST